ncbi:hypothetical protein N0V90_005880 [Kalmusia sp. IMI 367209]|nr:hypothetical protein N0V90_005880 [Kalmusia sp. IMI 367209]
MSISTQVPTGPIRDFEWCYAPLYEFGDPTLATPPIYSCANSTRGTKDSDFETFCCDGQIIGFYSSGLRVNSDFTFEDLQCCRIQEPQMGGIGPIPEDNGQTCTATATPTPLASLAATGTANAQPYIVTYLSAKQEGSTLTDWVVRETPYCFWVDTKHGVEMTSVEVPKAQVTTLPPETTDIFGDPIETSTIGRTTTEKEESEVTQTRSESEAESTGKSSATKTRSEETSGSGSGSGSVSSANGVSQTGEGTPSPTSASTALRVPAVMCMALLLTSLMVWIG